MANAAPPLPDGELSELLGDVRRIEAESGRFVASLMAGAWRSRFRGQGLEFEEVREYVAGDDPRAVDWNVTARFGRPFVKQFVDERERALLFVLDRTASMEGSAWAGRPRRAAARVVASLALAACSDHDRSGLLACGPRADHFVRPQAGRAAALRLVRDTLALPAQSGRAALAEALGAAATRLPAGSIVVLLSDFADDGWRTPALRCAARHDVIAVRLAAEELPPPAAGLVVLADPDHGGRRLVDCASAKVRAAAAAHVAQAREQWHAQAREAGLDRLELPVADSARKELALRLFAFFQGRALRAVRR